MYVFGGYRSSGEWTPGDPLDALFSYQVRFISGCEISWLGDYFIDSKEVFR